MVRVKSNLDGDIHRFVLPDPPSFDDLRAHLATIYSTMEFTVKYKDDEGDDVTVSSDEELLEAVASVPDSGLLRVEVLRSGTAPGTAATRNVTSPSVPEPAAQPTASTSVGAGPSSNPNPTSNDNNFGDGSDTPTLEQVMQGLAGMFAGLFGPFGMGGTGMRGMSGGGGFPGGMRGMGGGGGFPGGMRGMGGGGGFPGGMRGMGGGGFRGGMRGARFGRGRNCFFGAQPFGMPFMNFNADDIARFVREFDPQALGGEFANIATNTMESLRNLVAHFVTQSNMAGALQALPTVMPLLHGFVTELGSGAPVTPARVEALATAVNATLTVPLGADNARRVADFVRTAAADSAVQSILRRIPNTMGMSGVGGGNQGGGASSRPGNESMGRLDVHEGICCDWCEVMPIVGVRHWCTSQPNYDLCDRCFRDDGVNKEGKTFRAIEYPWENEMDRPLVPRPTLNIGSRGNEVLFLQHLLTNLGYMSATDYRFRAGMFGPKTAAAVNAFRRDCGLPPAANAVYDDVVAASLLSLIDAGVPPTAATGASTQPSEEGAAMDVDNSPTAV